MGGLDLVDVILTDAGADAEDLDALRTAGATVVVAGEQAGVVVMRLGAVADDVTGACDLAGRVVAAGLPASVLLGSAAAARGRDPVPDGRPGMRGRRAHGAHRPGGAGGRRVGRRGPLPRLGRCDPALPEVLLDVRLDRDRQHRPDRGRPGGRRRRNRDDRHPGHPGGRADAVPGDPLRRRRAARGVVDARPPAHADARLGPRPAAVTPQTREPVGLVRWEDVQRGPDAVAAAVRDGHTLVDALTEDDLDVIAEAVLRLSAEGPVVAGGGAGVATALARVEARAAGEAPRRETSPSPPSR